MIRAISEARHGEPGPAAMAVLAELDTKGEPAFLAYGVETAFAIYRPGMKRTVDDATGEVRMWTPGPDRQLSGKRIEEILYATDKGREAIERVKERDAAELAAANARKEREALQRAEAARRRAEVADVVKRSMPRFTSGTVRLAINGSAKYRAVPREVPAFLACGLAVHKSEAGTWVVTHAGSGLAILQGIGSRETARQLVARIGHYDGWTRATVDPSEVPSEVLEVIKAVRATRDGLAPVT